MKVLVLGGTRFMGRLLAWRLVAQGHEVTLFHRGTRAVPFAERVETLVGDRSTGVLPSLLEGRRFDATVDFSAFTPGDLALPWEALGHYVLISTGQVYLVREACPQPSRETDYDGPCMPRPADPADASQWEYGIGKRGCEDLLLREGVRATRVRIPMVNGIGDPNARIEGYLWRLLDGGPVLLPDGGDTPTRHIWAEDVAVAVAALLGDRRTEGEAYNLAQDETPTLRELLYMLAERVGVTPRLVEVPSARLRAEGFAMRSLSNFSQAWMSFIDPAKAREALDFVPTALPSYLDRMVSAFLATAGAERPEGYVGRAREIAFARALE